VHTGQNYDYELNEVFFEDLGLRKPDYFLNADTSSLASTLGSILQGTEKVIQQEAPEAFLVLGDTNSAISALIAKRMRVPVFHMEAGNRAFDENVPEETNRRFVDHIADYNLVYTDHARRNLLAEGVHPSRIQLTGSPMREVLEASANAIAASGAVAQQGLERGQYFLVSLHREENVDHHGRLEAVLESLNQLANFYNVPVLVSTHPRTRKNLEKQSSELKRHLVFHEPFGFNDYISLQQMAKLVLSDSGTISEESSLLGFPAVTLRDSIERPEALDVGAIVTTGVKSNAVLQAVAVTLEQFQQEGPLEVPGDYAIRNTSRRVLNFILSTAHGHNHRAGLHESAAR
jgi:UDP-N-acetylglucosamine 2-epimerase (non-hydrolysing)